MKKLSLVLVATGLLALSACNKTPAEQVVDNAADNASEQIENAADSLEAAADNATNEATEATLENAADNLHDAADNVGENHM